VGGLHLSSWAVAQWNPKSLIGSKYEGSWFMFTLEWFEATAPTNGRGWNVHVESYMAKMDDVVLGSISWN
jgi:hypothetical protein